MSIIPFNASRRQDIESGKCKVVNENGKPVRIVCWDRKGTDKPIIALTEVSPGVEHYAIYNENGSPLTGCMSKIPTLFLEYE